MMPNRFQSTMQRVARGLFGVEFGAGGDPGTWQFAQDWLRGLRKGCAFTYSISDAQPVKYVGVASRAGRVIAANGPETYNAFGRFNSFFMELHKDGEARPGQQPVLALCTACHKGVEQEMLDQWLPHLPEGRSLLEARAQRGALAELSR